MTNNVISRGRFKEKSDIEQRDSEIIKDKTGLCGILVRTATVSDDAK